MTINLFKLCSIMERVLQCQNELIKSSLFTEFTKLKELKTIAACNSLSLQVKANLEKGLIEQKLIKYKEKVLREMEEINLRKVEQEVKVKNEKVINESKQIINELEKKD